MPHGIVLSSSSVGATQEAIEDVLAKNGLEVEKPDVEEKPAVDVEPKRDDFDSEEDFEEAHVTWQDKAAKGKTAKDDDEEEEEPPAKKPSRVARKIDRATRELREQNEDLKKRLEALEKGGKKADEPAAEPNPRPDRTKFKTDTEYEDALLAWGVEKAMAEKTVKDSQRAQHDALETNLRSYRAQVEEFSEAHDDWDEVMSQDLPMHTAVQLSAMEADNGAEMMYYLGKHPEYAKRLAEMSPLSAVMEIGRLSKRLKVGASRDDDAANDAAEKKKTKTPRAPGPVTPVNTGATTSSQLTAREIAAKPNYAGKAKDYKRALREGR